MLGEEELAKLQKIFSLPHRSPVEKQYVCAMIINHSIVEDNMTELIDIYNRYNYYTESTQLFYMFYNYFISELTREILFQIDEYKRMVKKIENANRVGLNNEEQMKLLRSQQAKIESLVKNGKGFIKEYVTTDYYEDFRDWHKMEECLMSIRERAQERVKHGIYDSLGIEEIGPEIIESKEEVPFTFLRKIDEVIIDVRGERYGILASSYQRKSTKWKARVIEQILGLAKGNIGRFGIECIGEINDRRELANADEKDFNKFVLEQIDPVILAGFLEIYKSGVESSMVKLKLREYVASIAEPIFETEPDMWENRIQSKNLFEQILHVDYKIGLELTHLDRKPEQKGQIYKLLSQKGYAKRSDVEVESYIERELPKMIIDEEKKELSKCICYEMPYELYQYGASNERERKFSELVNESSECGLAKTIISEPVEKYIEPIRTIGAFGRIREFFLNFKKIAKGDKEPGNNWLYRMMSPLENIDDEGRVFEDDDVVAEMKLQDGHDVFIEELRSMIDETQHKFKIGSKFAKYVYKADKKQIKEKLKLGRNRPSEKRKIKGVFGIGGNKKGAPEM